MVECKGEVWPRGMDLAHHQHTVAVSQGRRLFLLTTAKLSPSLVVLMNRLERFRWTSAKAAATSSSARTAGSEINPLCTSGTHAEETRHVKMLRIAATKTKAESCERCRRHHILWRCPIQEAVGATKKMGIVQSR